MNLTQITLLNFKNYSHWEQEFVNGVNCITGLNGAGKTNILDAIYMLSFCRSHFQTVEKNVCLTNADYYSVKGHYDDLSIDFTVECTYRDGGRKQVKYNGNAYKKLSEHIGTIPLVMITPQDIFMIIEGSEERRRMMDITLGQLNSLYLEKLTEYYKILEHRNKLLKQLDESGTQDFSQLEMWNLQLIERGVYIYQARKELMNNLSGLVTEVYAQLANKRESITCNYISKLDDSPFDQLLNDSLSKDLILHRTTCGIHKDDLEFTMNGQLIKRFGSQGQQKTFVFAFKLALHQYLLNATGKSPILLLDDLFEKLDEKRGEHLLAYIASQSDTQVFITDTHHDRAKKVLTHMSSETLFIQI